MLDHSTFDEFDTAKVEILSDREVFTFIWTQPLKVFKFIKTYNYQKYLYLLCYLVGTITVLANQLENQHTYPIWVSFLIAFTLGGFLSWIFSYLFSMLLSGTGAWLGGKSNSWEIFRMNMYAASISLISGILWIIYNLFFDDYMYAVSASQPNVVLAFLLYGIIIGVEIWAMVVRIIGLAYLQKFPWWKALLNMIIAFSIIVFPIALLLVLFNW